MAAIRLTPSVDDSRLKGHGRAAEAGNGRGVDAQKTGAALGGLPTVYGVSLKARPSPLQVGQLKCWQKTRNLAGLQSQGTEIAVTAAVGK